MRKKNIIKKVSPIGILIRLISFVFFVYSIYEFDNNKLFESIYFIYIMIYTIWITYIMLRMVRNCFKLNSKARFKVIIVIFFIISLILLVNGIFNYVFSINNSIKNDIYSLFLVLFNASILSIEYSYFILSYKDINKNINNKN
ncbi:hypothetical protein [Senegalia massiliensis]|uniref:Uncharacterized protein n=1 Tax=Senegalia massiliensis TaxID=1720316 RepID=A0A845QX06_9CLOT|nr:hypothetical protein [Senegalia massiliensis]NBI05688.1 hypothetical protein [Senegalia massiliensis]